VLTDGADEAAIARGVFDAYTRLNLRYSQLAPLSMWDERNTGSNLPAQIELYAEDPDGHPDAYKFLFMAKGGGSANKSYLYQETKALLNPTRMMQFLEEKLRLIGTSACPPYHLAIVIGGTSAEYAVKTAKYASAKYLDALPTSGSPLAHGFRDVELEAEVLELTRQFGIGAQFGGRYFCPRRARGAAAPPRRLVSGGDRGLLLGRPAGAGEDHRRGRVPRAAGDRPRPASCPRCTRTSWTTRPSAST
jgi:fumarate hydratase class I